MSHAEQLGRYHLLERIAYGGMAEIYRARTFDRLGRRHDVAVKRVLAHLAKDDSFIDMLVDEAKIAIALRHPNIAQVYEFAQAGEEYFLAMEWVDGKDLRSILKLLRGKGETLPPEHAAYAIYEVANALHAAHTATDKDQKPMRIVHRDISPSNVLCAYTGEVKLCDFGIAKATLSKVNTKTGVIKGKIKYMSPEQALGRKLDHRSDIFSLGSCLYEMLTSKTPFRGDNEMDILVKVRDVTYDSISFYNPSVPDELQGIATRCMQRSRSRRYANAAELANDIAGFMRENYPDYTRSHFGAFMRHLFAKEIDQELRRLETFVVAQSAGGKADLGRNLLADALEPDATYTQFTPQQQGDEDAGKPENFHSEVTQIIPNRR